GPHSSPSYVSATPASYLQPLPSSPTPRSSDLDFADLAPQHMVANTVAAAALARAVDVPPAAIQQAIRGYALTEHRIQPVAKADRSEEHTSELQSRFDLVCRLLLEQKNFNTTQY